MERELNNRLSFCWGQSDDNMTGYFLLKTALFILSKTKTPHLENRKKKVNKLWQLTVMLE